MKTEEKHNFSYKNLLFVSCFAGLLGSLAVPSWTRQRDEDRMISAKRHAEVLGYQIFEIYQQGETLTSRSPASLRIGSIGNDPWGQPYRYKVLSATGGDQLRVQIWSAGPNKIFETKDQPGIGADTYTGDDVGIILSLSHKPTE